MLFHGPGLRVRMLFHGPGLRVRTLFHGPGLRIRMLFHVHGLRVRMLFHGLKISLGSFKQDEVNTLLLLTETEMLSMLLKTIAPLLEISNY